MSAGFNSSDDIMYRNASLPSATLCTIAGWVQLVSDRTNQWRYFFNIENGVTNASDYKSLGINSSNQFDLSAGVGGSYNSAQFAATPANGAWFYAAMVCNGAGAGSIIGYYITAGRTVYTATLDNMGSFTVARLSIGNDSYAEWNNLIIAHVKVWDAALSESELLAEMSTANAVRTSNLHARWPMAAGNRTADASGNSRPLTEAGTLYDGSDPALGGHGQLLAQCRNRMVICT